MYKTRIKQWGLDKNHKENEMRAIVRKTKTLGSKGRSATFRVRGRPVDYKNVVSYFKRKNVRLEDVITQTTRSKTPEAVDYFITVPSPITTPESIATPERILVSIRDYLRGSFENGTWVTTGPQMGYQSTRGQEYPRIILSQLFNECQAACQLFRSHRFQEAGQILVSATSRIRDIILAEHPETLENIFFITLRLLQEQKYEVALAILRQFSALADIVMRKTHPVGRICGWLASIAPSQWETIIARCTGSLADHFESLAGPLNMSTIYSRLKHINSEVDTEYDMNQRLLVLKNLLKDCETSLEPEDLRIDRIRIRLAWCYIDLSDYAEAMKVGWDLITCTRPVVGQERRFYLYTEGLYIVAESEHAMGDVYSAEIHLREAIELRISRYGPNNSRARRLLVILEVWLVEQGYFDSAAQVHERWKKSLPDCADYV